MSQKQNDKRKDSWEDKESKDMKKDEQRKDRKKGKGKQFNRRAPKGEGRNDVSWYGDPQMIRDAASLAWANQTGQPITRKGIDRTIRDAVPGVACMHLCPVLGNVDSPTDPVNVAAQGLYSDVRHANSGHSNYDPTDLMIYIMTLDSIYYWTAWITRIYATANMYAMENKYLPDMLFAAQGVDGASIRANLPAFRVRANNLILKAATLVIPNTMPIFNRHSMLFQNYYTEGNSIKDQLYMFKPDLYYIFQYDSNGAGMLKAMSANTAYNATTLLDTLESMIDAVYMDEDFGIMAGDILKAYGESNVHKIGFIPDGIVAQPVYDYLVLQQFKNAKCYLVDPANLDITQYIDPNYPVSPYLKQKAPYNSWSFGKRFWPVDYYYNSPLEYSAGMDSEFKKVYYAFMNEVVAPELLVSSSPSVTPEETMESTRLTMIPEVSVTADSNGDPVVNLIDMHYGTEIPMYVTYCGFHYTSGSDVPIIKVIDMVRHVLINYVTGISDVTNPNYAYDSLLGLCALMQSFKFHPSHNIFAWSEDTNGTKAVEWHTLPMIDIDNYTVATVEEISRMHNVATLGEYAVPRRGLA